MPIERSETPTPPRRRLFAAAVLLLAATLLSAGALPSGAEQTETAPAGETHFLPDGTPVRPPAAEAAGAAGDEAEAADREKPVRASPGWTAFLLRPHYLAFAALMLVGVVLLAARWVSRWVRIAMLALAFVLFGLDLVFPLHPSPMCATTNLFTFKAAHGRFFPQFTALFLVMMVPSLIGRKLFCGWVCPLGALQSLVHRIPSPIRWRRFSFTAFNAVRFALLGLFFLTIFAIRDWIAALAERVGADATTGIWAAFSAYSLYEPINFF